MWEVCPALGHWAAAISKNAPHGLSVLSLPKQALDVASSLSQNTLGLEAVLSVSGKVLTLTKPVALVLTRCAKPSFIFTVFTAVCVHPHMARGSCWAHPSPGSHIAMSVLPPHCFSLQSLEANSPLGMSLKWAKILGYRLANPFQGKEQWGQVSCGDDNILFTQHCCFGTPTGTFPGLFDSCWVYGLEGEHCFWWLWALWWGICLHSPDLQTTVAQLRISSSEELPQSLVLFLFLYFPVVTGYVK